MLGLRTQKDTSNLNQFPAEEIVVLREALKVGSEWQVRIDGIYWKAKAAVSNCDFMPGDLVRIIERKGLTLLLEPVQG